MFEKRDRFMVSPTGGGIPTIRTGHFLEPTSDFVSGPEFTTCSFRISSGLKRQLKVKFCGWREPQRKWAKWVDRMRSTYSTVWKKAGIDKAIMASTFHIRRNNDLIYGLAERWCSQTNTFIFPWGEATITLEDMMVLGGFSVLGSPFSLPLESKELVEIKDEIEKTWKELGRLRSSGVQHSLWLKHFMETDSKVEHEAFLMCWLSRYVFPGNSSDYVNKHVLPIAVHLARGTRIALAPSVLASIYRDFSFLKRAMVKGDCESGFLSLVIRAPFVFAQTWAWERILELQPKPRFLSNGELRLARWRGVKTSAIENVQSIVASAGNNFLWRPYTIAMNKWAIPKFYKEQGGWFAWDSASDEELVSFVWCLRVCELVGLDCKESYFPNRVAMQFGLDQDIPEWIPPSRHSTTEIAWIKYGRPISDAKVYIPARLFEADVTINYLRWWNSLRIEPQDAVKPFITKQRTPRKCKRLQEINKGSETRKKHNKRGRSVSYSTSRDEHLKRLKSAEPVASTPPCQAGMNENEGRPKTRKKRKKAGQLVSCPTLSDESLRRLELIAEPAMLTSPCQSAINERRPELHNKRKMDSRVVPCSTSGNEYLQRLERLAVPVVLPPPYQALDVHRNSLWKQH